ncbi:hypothetical protein [uncultured phage cr106_1]|uniref:Uncharacterized protein n=1 Tax=uncultured phage cr106_1 TaxID=2772062 RepID=A0A7M1RZ26_9CAUD|nr:hypothetical protein KNV29_gp016 [uncultured phage cr106_1]QOR58270.1 hypothetical protein [uncultured phage cr106_1]
MKSLNGIAISPYPVPTNMLWLHKGTARYFNNGKWTVLGEDSSISFNDVTDKPTTLEGYGITDAVKAVEGKGLSTNDYTDEDMQDVGEMRTNLTKPVSGGVEFYNVWATFSKSVKSLELVKNPSGVITGGTLFLIDDTSIPVVIKSDGSIVDDPTA